MPVTYPVSARVGVAGGRVTSAFPGSQNPVVLPAWSEGLPVLVQLQGGPFPGPQLPAALPTPRWGAVR